MEIEETRSRRCYHDPDHRLESRARAVEGRGRVNSTESDREGTWHGDAECAACPLLQPRTGARTARGMSPSGVGWRSMRLNGSVRREMQRG